MPYTGDKYQHCKRCGKRTKWVRCPQPPGSKGKGNTRTTTCGNNCDSGYKCDNGARDKWHG